MSTRPLILAGALLTWAASPAAAQVPGINLDLIPKLGVFAPLTDLSELPDGIRTRLQPAFAIGLGLELNLPLSPLNVRANLEFVPNATVEAEAGTPGALDVDLLALVGDIVFRPVQRLSVTHPYLMVGAGIKRYNFGGGALAPVFPESITDFTLHLGGGLDLRVGVVSLIVEIGNYTSWFSPDDDGSRIQHDLFGMLGVRVGML